VDVVDVTDTCRSMGVKVVLVTPNGIIMRDAQGLRSWTFEDLTDSSSWVHADRVDLLE